MALHETPSTVIDNLVLGIIHKEDSIVISRLHNNHMTISRSDDCGVSWNIVWTGPSNLTGPRGFVQDYENNHLYYFGIYPYEYETLRFFCGFGTYNILTNEVVLVTKLDNGYFDGFYDAPITESVCRVGDYIYSGMVPSGLESSSGIFIAVSSDGGQSFSSVHEWNTTTADLQYTKLFHSQVRYDQPNNILWYSANNQCTRESYSALMFNPTPDTDPYNWHEYTFHYSSYSIIPRLVVDFTLRSDGKPDIICCSAAISTIDVDPYVFINTGSIGKYPIYDAYACNRENTSCEITCIADLRNDLNVIENYRSVYCGMVYYNYDLRFNTIAKLTEDTTEFRGISFKSIDPETKLNSVAFGDITYYHVVPIYKA